MTDTNKPQQLCRWQRPDGFPNAEYFAAVLHAFSQAAIDVEDSSREEAWEYNIEIAPESYMYGPLKWAKHGLYISWRCDEMDEPKHADDFTGLGWYWVPYTNSDTALGDFTEQLTHPAHHACDAPLVYLAEPDEVAAAVARLLREGRKRWPAPRR